MLGVYSSAGTLLASTTLTLGAANPLDDDGFKYAALPAPLILAAGQYYIGSDEVVGQAYADYNTSVFPNSDVTEVVPAYFNGVVWTPVSSSPGHAYGPLNLIYYPKP
jgi:hypothetical protein